MPSTDGIEPINSFSKEAHDHCPSPLRSPDNRRIPMNIAVYVRVSTQRQAQAQTIEQQLDSLRKYHEAQGWPWQEEHIFRDDGGSSAKLRRPGLDRLREQVGRATFDRMVITAPDRLARNYVHQMLLIEEFERGG
jgi:site-specific DNA recombinase